MKSLLKLKDSFNNSGFAFIDIITSLLVLLVIILVMGQFQGMLLGSQSNSRKNSNFIKEVNNKISDIYEEGNWSNLIDEEFKVDGEDFKISYEYKGRESHETDVLEVTFKYWKFNKSYNLERSIYSEK